MRTLTERLKEETRNLHDETEKKFRSDTIFSGEFTKENYEQLISVNHKFFSSFESAVHHKISELSSELNLDNRKRAHLAAKDLEHLGIIQNLNSADVQIGNPAEAAGMMYVMEGSSLGGNMIRKQLQRQPDFADYPLHFFGAYAENTGKMWKNFKDFIDSGVFSGQEQHVISGAKKAYQFLLENSNK